MSVSICVCVCVCVCACHSHYASASLCVGESLQDRDQVALLEKQVSELREQLLAKDTVVEQVKTEMESLIKSHKAAMKVSGEAM